MTNVKQWFKTIRSVLNTEFLVALTWKEQNFQGIFPYRYSLSRKKYSTGDSPEAVLFNFNIIYNGHKYVDLDNTPVINSHFLYWVLFQKSTFHCCLQALESKPGTLSSTFCFLCLYLSVCKMGQKPLFSWSCYISSIRKHLKQVSQGIAHMSLESQEASVVMVKWNTWNTHSLKNPLSFCFQMGILYSLQRNGCK